MNAEIIAWLESSREYARGVELIAKYGGEVMARSYRRASPRFMQRQIEVLLRKLADRTEEKGFSTVPGSAQPSQPHSSQAPGTGTAEEEGAAAAGKKAEVPEKVKVAKERLRELWQQLNNCHKQLLGLGNDNDEETKKKRVKLMKEREPIVEAFEKLYDLKEGYFALPEGERRVPPELEKLLAELDGKAEKDESGNMAAELKGKGKLELYKLRKSTLEKIRRRHNQLMFQQDTPGEKNPMPEGARRKKKEEEMAELQKLLKEIDKLLKEE